jgi:hypothetical protein
MFIEVLSKNDGNRLRKSLLPIQNVKDVGREVKTNGKSIKQRG